ncbi:hypothetical protein CCACVL1_24864 [Corchorus capsularis]|uniref:Uncharacterized protein n=1 Tax=Corchorus capsularis TaxID=210143 RepID=A0A1R3GMW0_COCAP|nr:hypothetical protein CCACVL1_24864 [Corchorus capsularis]
MVAKEKGRRTMDTSTSRCFNVNIDVIIIASILLASSSFQELKLFEALGHPSAILKAAIED